MSKRYFLNVNVDTVKLNVISDLIDVRKRGAARSKSDASYLLPTECKAITERARDEGTNRCRCGPQTAKLVLDEYFESAGALEAMALGSGDFFTLSQRPAAALLLRDDAALNGADDDVFAAPAPAPAGDEHGA